MNKITDYFKSATKAKKLTFLIVITTLILMCAIGIPTLARLKNRSTIDNVSIWDGTIASSYKSGDGSINSPYMISNGSELAYFAQELLNNNYENTYFALANDIIINDGIFAYDEINGPQIIINGNNYYIKEYSNKYYPTSLRSGTETGSLNIFGSLSNFKGHIDGRFFSIYGLYITDNTSKELGLFKNLQGEVKNLYVENALIYGQGILGGLSSSTTGSIINNVMVDGCLVNNNSQIDRSLALSVSDINVQNTEQNLLININKNFPILGSSNISTTLTGTYTVYGASNDDINIKINGIEVSNGEININLGGEILDSLTITTSTALLNNPTVKISNLSYNISYEYSASAGIVGYSQNTEINNAINKLKIYGGSVSGGIVGVSVGQLNLNNTYNKADILSQNYSGGLIGVIENSFYDVSINNSYNSSNILSSKSGGLVGVINNNSNQIYINNSFNAYENDYVIDSIINSSVNVSNSYYLNTKNDVRAGNTEGSFIGTLVSNFKDKTFVISNLNYNEFESFSDLAINPNNLWVYEEGELPIIYIDDEVNNSAVLTSGNYVWNNYSSELNTFNLYSTISFSIDDINQEKPVKEKYYFINNSNNPLTKVELANSNNWVEYTSPVNINGEGSHIIYVKIIDYDNKTIYMNSDIININLSSSSINVGFDNYNWNCFKTNISNVYIGAPKAVKLTVDNEANVSEIKYYISSTELSITDLNNLSTNDWAYYNNDIEINQLGEYIIYVSVIENNNKFYINTDKIIYGGYEEKNFIIGDNPNTYLGELNNISSRSKLSFDVSFSDLDASNISSYNHNIVSNMLLPKNTIITIYDKITNKVYKYKINTDEDIYNFNNSCDENNQYCTKVATYPFSLFSEVGISSEDNYIEQSYYDNGQINENYTVFIDFSNALITETKENVGVYLLLKNNSGIVIRPTIESTITRFNIYSTDNNADLNLTTDYNLDSIRLNSDSTASININSYLRYKKINNANILDTYYEDKNVGLLIKIVDNNGELVSRDKLKNIVFKMNDKTYSFGEDNLLRINLANKMLDTQNTLNILTYANGNTLQNGDYKIIISNYAAFDGENYNQISNQQIVIPLAVYDYIDSLNYKFDVFINSENQIIKRETDNPSILFNIIQSGIVNPSIKVSLYKKDSLTAYNQNYTLVDLQTYTSTPLNSYMEKIYSITNSPIKYDGTANTYNPLLLNLIMNKFENTSYKFVFELYSNNLKVGTINKYFVVK